MNAEDLRRTYQPRRVKTLFVGESAPVGGNFFYRGDSALFRYSCEGFDARPESFLDEFRDRGFWLVDLCGAPVNGLSRPERRSRRRQGVGPLAEIIRGLRPEAVVVVMKGILPDVHRALELADLGNLKPHALPFPAFGHQRKYVSGLRELLPDLPTA